jgi:hypothetical protein
MAVELPHLFMIEHAAPGRVMLDLTAYITVLAQQAQYAVLRENPPEP